MSSGPPIIALFCGSREWTDRERIRRDLESLPEDSVVIEGGAPGADRIARQEAQKLGIHVATVNALWDYYDKPAGYRRNEAMARLQPDYVYAYPLGGPGTAQMIKIAEDNCIPVREP
ncbi:MAG TPA: SLOG family protein [Solirubrobacterales bacterium]